VFVVAGDREAGWAFEARRRAVRKLPGGSGSFDGISEDAGGGSTTTEEVRSFDFTLVFEFTLKAPGPVTASRGTQAADCPPESRCGH
jgi:hypothetical protein